MLFNNVRAGIRTGNFWTLKSKSKNTKAPFAFFKPAAKEFPILPSGNPPRTDGPTQAKGSSDLSFGLNWPEAD